MASLSLYECVYAYMINVLCRFTMECIEHDHIGMKANDGERHIPNKRLMMFGAFFFPSHSYTKTVQIK